MGIAGRIYGWMRKSYFKKRYAGYRTRFDIHPDFVFRGRDIELYGEGTLHLGASSYMGHRCSVATSPGVEVKVGTHCRIAHGVRIYATSNLSDQDFITDKALLQKTGNVTIGNGVWIGAGAVILPGVTIGDNAIVGANSVVVENVDAHTIVSGVPAKTIRKKSLG